MEIRRARDDELDAVSEMLSRAYAEYASVLPSPEAFAEYRASVADVRGREGQSQLWIADDDGAVAGSLDYYAPGESPYHRFVGFPPDWAAFRFLGTDPERRGSGAGRALVGQVIALGRADGASHLGLHTGPFMKTAMAMYERMGFERSPEHDFSPVPEADLRVLGYRLALD